MDKDDFRSELQNIFTNAVQHGEEFVVVNSGALHRAVGGYPGTNHRMPVCCTVMRSAMRPGDEILEQPPQGDGASLSIRYILPRE